MKNKLNKKNLEYLVEYGLIFLLTFLILILIWQFGAIRKAEERNLEYFALPKAKPIWEKKLETTEKVKVGIITDNHIRPTRINRYDESPTAPRIIRVDDLNVLNKFNKQMNVFHPNLIIHLGDSIEGADDPDYVGISGIALMQKEISKSNVPIYWVLGNHELRSITKEQFKETLNLENLDYIRDFGDYRFIFLDGNYNPNNEAGDFFGHGYIPGFLHPKTVLWLEEQLRTDKRVIVFMHQSILSQEYLNYDQIAKNPALNGREIMDLFEKYNVEAFFNGHIESRYYQEVGGVKYYSLPGTKKSLEYPESYYELEINGSEESVNMFYLDVLNKSEKIINFETGEDIKK